MVTVTFVAVIGFLSALQRLFAENSKQIFPEMKLRSLVPSSYIHVSVSDRGIYKSLTDIGNEAAL
jgi:hypothetical protein